MHLRATARVAVERDELVVARAHHVRGTERRVRHVVVDVGEDVDAQRESLLGRVEHASERAGLALREHDELIWAGRTGEAADREACLRKIELTLA